MNKLGKKRILLCLFSVDFYAQDRFKPANVSAVAELLLLGSPDWCKNETSKDRMIFCWTPVLGLGLGVDFSFTWDNNNKNNENNDNDKNNPHLNFLKGTSLGDKEHGGRDKG